MRHRYHYNPQGEQYSESERCSDQECIHLLPFSSSAQPDHSRPGRAALSEQKVQVGNITPPELFAGGFVDFLLGRGARQAR